MEWFGVCRVGADIAPQFSREVGDGGEDATRNNLAFDTSKPDLDLVQPGRVSRREVQAEIGMIGKERIHKLCFVCREVVQNDVDFLMDWTARDDF